MAQAGQYMSRSYKTRNGFYLRISPYSVLNLLLYLDPRHTEWMSDDVLERVLNALRDRIVVKLKKESAVAGGGGKEVKAKVDVYRGAGYQMAYFFRKTNQKHSVLLKDKILTYQTPPPPDRDPPLPVPSSARSLTKSQTPRARRQSRTPAASGSNNRTADVRISNSGDEPSSGSSRPEPSQARRSTRVGSSSRMSYAEMEGDDDEEEMPGEEEGYRPEIVDDDGEDEDEIFAIPSSDVLRKRNHGKGKSAASNTGADVTVKEENDDDIAFQSSSMLPNDSTSMLVDDDDVKPDKKPILKVRYTGFSIFGRTLVVIVEPYPPLNSTQLARYTPQSSVRPSEEIRELSVAPSNYSQSRSPSLAPSEGLGVRRSRSVSGTPFATNSSKGKMPLFRDETPMSDVGESDFGGGIQGDGDDEEDDGMSDLRARSQFMAEADEEADGNDDAAEERRAGFVAETGSGGVGGGEGSASSLIANFSERGVEAVPKDLSIRQFMKPSEKQSPA